MEQAKLCKHNMKCYPIYRMLSYDFLFYYTINVLFLTQVKHITPSQVILIEVAYSTFGVLSQIPASLILEKIGRKKSLILGTFSNAIYLIVVIMGNNFIQLLIAELAAAFGFALKDVASPTLLNESIPVTKRRSEIFGKLNGKAMSGYYILNAISLVISGFLYGINPYTPMILSLIIVLITFLLANYFYEPLKIDDDVEKEEKANLKESLKFIFTSGRLKSLIFYSSIMISLINILVSSEIYLIEELDIPSSAIGIIFAALGVFSGIAAKNQEKFHKLLKNKTLTVLGITISLTCIVSSLAFMFNLAPTVTLTIILVAYIFKYIVVGVYHVLITKYLSNFTNEEIDSKIYTAQIFFNNAISAICGIAASALLTKIDIVKSTLIFGITSLVLFLISIIYMKNKLGLKPNEYSKEEIKYAKIK